MASVEHAPARAEQVSLVRRMAGGDEEAARQVLAAHGSELLRFVRRRLGGPIEDAEEVVQDTFVTAARMGSTFDGSSSTATWLCALARARVADFLRRTNRYKRKPAGQVLPLDPLAPGVSAELHAPEIPIEDLVERIERERVVAALLASMTPDQREVVTLRYLEGFSVSEVARITRRSEKAIERLLERAKERPRRQIVRWLGTAARDRGELRTS